MDLEWDGVGLCWIGVALAVQVENQLQRYEAMLGSPQELFWAELVEAGEASAHSPSAVHVQVGWNWNVAAMHHAIS